MLVSSVRIRFTFVDQNTQNSIQRLYLADIETLSTARSVAARFLQKALGHNSFQSEVVSLSIEGYEIPLLESSRIFRDDDTITVKYTAASSAIDKGSSMELDSSIDDESSEASQSCTEDDRRRRTSRPSSLTTAEGTSKRRRKRKRIRKRKRKESTNASDCVITNRQRTLQQGRPDEASTSPSINPSDVTSVWRNLQSTRPTSTEAKSSSSSLLPTKRNTSASVASVEVASEVEAATTAASTAASKAATAAASTAVDYEWEPIDTSTTTAALRLQSGDSIYCVLTMDEAAYGSVEHMETIEISSGHTELSLTVLLYDAQHEAYTRRYLQLPDESIQLFRLRPSHSEGHPDESYYTAANVTDHTEAKSVASEEKPNDVLFWLLAKKAQLESSSSSAPST